MRPPIVRRLDERVVRLPRGVRASLRSVQTPDAVADPAELWVGLHLESLNGEVTLEQLATSAQRFSPRLSLVPPDGLLLEVKGSLHLFGGTAGLLRAVTDECAAVRIEPAIALAPTPLAAIVAARAGSLATMGQPEVGQPFVVTNPAQLVGRMSSLPLAPLRWPDDVVERLARMGVRTIGQALRLPRAGFARRFGPEYLGQLDRLTGRSADLRKHFQPRERFRRRRELTYELESKETLLAVMSPLLKDLGKFLQARQSGVTELECQLRHRHVPPTRCVLQLSSPMADVDRLTELLAERLNALVLPEPVRSCELRTGLPMRRVLASNPLWQPGEHGGSGGPESPELIERLRARLGHDAVYGLGVLAGHRPENAWCKNEPSALAGTRPDPKATRPDSIRCGRSPRLVPPWPAFRRPLWLLHTPQQLEETDGVPRRHGTLRFFGDVERIETGWWDGGDIGRDYYTVVDIYGVQLWIFRQRADPHRWFLHGVFG
jgi:protein ImuB